MAGEEGSRSGRAGELESLQLLLKARNLIREGKWGEAAVCIRWLRRIDPNKARSLARHVEIILSSGLWGWRDAARCYRRLRSLDPEGETVWLDEEVRALVMAGLWDEASPRIRRLHEINAKRAVELLRFAAETLGELGMWREAAECYHKLCGWDPERRLEYLHFEAEALEKAGLTEEARTRRALARSLRLREEAERRDGLV